MIWSIIPVKQLMYDMINDSSETTNVWYDQCIPVKQLMYDMINNSS